MTSPADGAAQPAAAADAVPADAVTADAVLAALFPGGSELARRCRAFDWAATPLGPAATWPAALRVAAQMVVAAGLPNIVLWGPGLVQLYNDSYARLIRAKHPLALGRGNREVWPEVWHLNGPVYARVFAGETVTVEDAYYPLLREGAEGAWAEEDAYLTISFSPIRDESGAVAGVLANMLETTREVERRRLAGALTVERDRFRQAFDQAPGFVGVLRGPDHRYEYVNGPYAQISGHRPLLGRTVREAFPELAGQGFYELLDRVYGSGEPFVGQALPIQLQPLPGGPVELRRIDFVYQPLLESDAGGAPRVVGILVQGRDVTDAARNAEALAAAHAQLQDQRAELELTNQQLQENAAELEAQAEELAATAAHLEEQTQAADAARAEAEAARTAAEAANRGKSEFLAVMSHELRTPLNAIGGYTELLDMGVRGSVTAEQRADLARIQRAQRHLLGLINGVLNYARVEAGAVHYALADVPLDEVLATCEALVAPQVRAKGLALVHPPTPPHVRVRADRDKVQQVVLNLLSNAVKFTEPGGRVTLASSASGVSASGVSASGMSVSGMDASGMDASGVAAGGVVRVTVADTGIGIPADQLARVFEPFVQLDARLTRTQEGTGLGLAISRDLARGMGGELTAESAPGAGSTFTLTLPAGGTPAGEALTA